MLYLIRHGQTDWNLMNKIQGQYDVPLNDTGRGQAINVTDKLSRLNLEYIISSDLSRASETAQIIGNKLNIRVDYDARLREYDFGILTGMTRNMLDPNSEQAFFANPTYFNAESFDAAFARVKGFLESVDFNKNILVVTHGGVINFVLCYLENKDNFQSYMYYDKCLRIKINNSSILRIRNLESEMSVLKNTRFFALPKTK